MDTKTRREEIVKILDRSKAPVSASRFAELFGVSRQTIVGDIAVLRASGVNISAYAKGYVIEKKAMYSRVFKVIHSDDEVEKELGLIVDLGGVVEDVFVFHRVYGKLAAPMNITNKSQIKRFISEIRSGKSSLLKNVTSGYHYHTVSSADPDILEKIEMALKEEGFLAPLKPYEPIGIGESRY